MAYCDPIDVRGVLARDVTDPEGTGADAFDEALLVYQITAAQAEVDARLAGRYQVPFPDGNVPPLVHSLTVDVAAYLATLTYRQNKLVEPTAPAYLRYQRALDILQRLSEGVMDLPEVPDPDDGGTTPGTVSAISVRNPYEGRMFGLRDFGLGIERARRRRGW